MHEFDYLEPSSVVEASDMLAELGEDCRVIAGGTALMLAMRQRMLNPSHLVSMAKLTQLRSISADGQGWLRIGALCQHADVAESPLVQAQWSMLASMAGRVANPQVRHQGTLGGNLCYGDPATDPPSCLMALNAQVVLASSVGERVLPISDFLVDYYTTALAPEELLTEIRIPPLAQGTAALYTRHLRTAADHRPLVNVALIARQAGAACAEARIVVGASTAIPTRASRAEAFLQGKVPSIGLIAEAADLIAADIEPLSDARGDADYRRDMVRVVSRRSMAKLFGLREAMT